MALDDDIRFFSQIPMLAILGGQALRILAIGAEMRFLPKGTVLFHAGDLADSGYIVQDGTFAIEAASGENREPEIVGRGALLGELAMITDTVRPATVTALEPATVLRIPRSLFLKMLEGFPEAARSLRDSFAARTDQWARELRAVKSMLEGADRRT